MTMTIRAILLAQELLEYGLRTMNKFRATVLLPLFNWGGRDMLLLKNGSWIDASVKVTDPTDVTLQYSFQRHEVTAPNTTDKVPRWPWLSVSQGSLDMSEFFASLRAVPELTAEQAIMLYAYQNQWLPSFTEPVKIMNREDGSESELLIFPGLILPGPILPGPILPVPISPPSPSNSLSLSSDTDTVSEPLISKVRSDKDIADIVNNFDHTR
jgi:hypothetical protein